MAKPKKKKRSRAAKRPASTAAATPPQAAANNNGDDWPVLARGIRIAGASLAALFVMSVLLFAAFGDTWVNGLDDQVGEIVSSRAREQADMGQHETAINLYRDALAVRFDDPMQRVWTLHRLARLLLREERYDEAVEAAQEALDLHDENGAPFSYINEAYHESRQFEAMAHNAERWFQWAAKTGRANAQADAKHQRGIALHNLGRKEEAISAFEEAFALRPREDVAFDAGRNLALRGDLEQARPYLEYVVKHANDWRRGAAQSLLDRKGD